jgi:hypothetical protein
VLQIVQLIQDYQHLVQSTSDFSTDEEKNKNQVTENLNATQLLGPNSLQKEIYHSTEKGTEEESPHLRSIKLNFLKNRYFIPYETSMHDQTNISYENLEKRKHDLQQIKFLESDNMIY